MRIAQETPVNISNKRLSHVSAGFDFSCNPSSHCRKGSLHTRVRRVCRIKLHAIGGSKDVLCWHRVRGDSRIDRCQQAGAQHQCTSKRGQGHAATGEASMSLKCLQIDHSTGGAGPHTNFKAAALRMPMLDVGRVLACGSMALNGSMTTAHW